MRARQKKLRSQPESASALALLEASLNTPTEAEWYAARLERLGRVIFGDLWDPPTVSPTRDPGTQDTGREP